MTGGERGSPRTAPGKRGGGRGEALARLQGHSGGVASINQPGVKGDFQGYPRFPGYLYVHKTLQISTYYSKYLFAMFYVRYEMHIFCAVELVAGYS